MARGVACGMLSAMRIGIHGGTQIVMGAGWRQVAEHAAQAEAEGFSSYWVNQQVVPDALTLLAAVGQATSTIELGTAVVNTWTRHPAMLAAQALTTQEITGGRLALGIGLAHRPSTEGTYEIPFTRPAANMAEYLDVLLPAVRDRAVEASGRYWSAHMASMGGPPDVAAPPVLIAAMGPRMLELCGARTDGNVLWLSGPRTIAEKIRPAMDRAAEAAGRPPGRIVASTPICVTDRVDEVRGLIGTFLANYDTLPSYRAVMDFEGVGGVADISIVGDEDQVRAEVARYADAGATDFVAPEFTLQDDEAARTRALLRELAVDS